MTDCFLAERNGWINTVRDCLFPSTVKLVALTIASYGGKEGDEIYPSVRRLSVVTQLGESTVRKSLKFLRDNFLLYRKVRGSNYGAAGLSDHYQLILPKDYKTRWPRVPGGRITDVAEYRQIHSRKPREDDPWAVADVKPARSGDRNTARR